MMIVRSFCVLALLLLLGIVPAQAQAGSALSVGAQVGRPTALTIRAPSRAPASWTGVLAFDDGNVYLGLNRQYEYPVTASPLRYYVGPGGYIGSARNDDLALGATLNLGVNFYQERFEIFLQLIPDLRLLPSTDFGVGAAVGVRYAL